MYQECDYAVVNVADNSTTVHTGRCRLYGIYVNTVLSAQACPIEDGTTAIVTLPASLAAGSNLQFPGVEFRTSLVVDPDDSATGNITVFFKPM
jgi:hypothetical protein